MRYDFFVFVFSSLVALFLIKSRAKRKVLVLRLNSKNFRAKRSISEAKKVFTFDTFAFVFCAHTKEEGKMENLVK